MTDQPNILKAVIDPAFNLGYHIDFAGKLHEQVSLLRDREQARDVHEKEIFEAQLNDIGQELRSAVEAVGIAGKRLNEIKDQWREHSAKRTADRNADFEAILGVEVA